MIDKTTMFMTDTMSIEEVVMFKCDICGAIDYFITNSVWIVKRQARQDKAWVFKDGKEICMDCYKERIKE